MMHMAINAAGGILGATWLACMLTFFLECRPIHLYWQVVPNTPHCAVSLSLESVIIGLR